MIGTGDYMLITQIWTDLTDYQAQWQTGTHARGYYGISVLILCGEKCYKFIHETKDKIQGQKSFKETILDILHISYVW